MHTDAAGSLLVSPLSLAVMVLGLILFLASGDPPVPKERMRKLGFAMFCIGLLAFLFLSQHTIRIF